jgi:hypothetical protein
MFYIAVGDNKQLGEQQQVIDSLQQELYITNINLSRYEMTLELLSEQDSLSAVKFDSIYTNETE